MSQSLDPSAPPDRRWLPTLAFGLVLAGGLLALVWEGRRWRETRRENAILEVAASEAAVRLAADAEARRLRTATAAERQRQDHEELQKLRGQVWQLKPIAQKLPALRTEAARLEAQRTEAAAQAGVVEEGEDLFKAARERALQRVCIQNLKQVGLAARIFANDNQDVMPPDYLTMSNELNTPKILTCPSDTARKPADSWATFSASSVSYEYLSPSVKEDAGTDVVITRCPIHPVVGLLEGSVQRFDPAKQRLAKVNGFFRLVRAEPEAP